LSVRILSPLTAHEFAPAIDAEFGSKTSARASSSSTPRVPEPEAPFAPGALRAFLFSFRAKSAWNQRSPWRDRPCPSRTNRTALSPRPPWPAPRGRATKFWRRQLRLRDQGRETTRTRGDRAADIRPDRRRGSACNASPLKTAISSRLAGFCVQIFRTAVTVRSARTATE
jgi:hypothetical protein